MDKLIELINKRKEVLALVVNYVNDDLEFLDNVLVNNNYSKLSGLMEMNFLDILVGYLISVSDKFSAKEISELLRKFNFSDFVDELGKEDIDIIDFFRSDNRVKVDKIKRCLKKKEKNLNLDSIELLEETYGEELLRILFIFNVIEGMKRDYQLCVDQFDDILSDIRVCERVSSKKRNKCYSQTLRARYNVDNIIRDLSIIENKYNELNSLDKKKKREARKAISNYDVLLEILNNFSNYNLFDINLFNKLINLVEDEDILRELLFVLNSLLKPQFDIYHQEYLKLSSDSEVSVQAIFRNHNINFNDLPGEIKSKVFDLNQEELIRFLDLFNLYNINDFKSICYILNNSSVEVMGSLNNWVKTGFVTKTFLVNNLTFFSLNGFNDFSKKIKLFNDYGINPRSIIADLDIYLSSYEVLKRNLNILKLYKLLDGINKLDSFEMFKCNDLCSRIDLLLELGYEKLLEGNVGVLNASIDDIKKLYILKSLEMLPSDMNEVVNVLNNKEFLSYVDDSYLFNIVDYRIDTSLVDGEIIDVVIDSNCNDRVVEVNGIYLSRNRIVRNLKRLEKVDISNEEKICYAMVKDSILTEDEYNSIISNKDVIVRVLKNND